ncbi:unnamed protein product [Blepharisma stoltei]|uniref:J domain-containing protein n=1 Tax=Blepharisma stoltei TaxID=1481888 RepID=A0AAU9K0E9_9CILI|nr:unnamed protein product [Blepharisma stoltei]
MSSDDYYSLLGVHPDATPDEIKESFQNLSLLTHPDKQPVHLRENAQQSFNKLLEARDVLLDQAKRFAYDRYGQAGVDLLKNKNYAIQTLDDQHKLDRKLKGWIKLLKEQEIRAELNPKSSAIMALTCAKYIDSLDHTYYKQKEIPVKPSLRLESLQLQESVKYDFTENVSGNIGFMIYTKGGFGFSTIMPNIMWRWKDYVAQAQVQVGDRNACAVSITKNFEKMSIVGQVNVLNGGALGTLMIQRRISDTCYSDLKLQQGLTNSFEAGVHKNFGEKKKVSLKSNVNQSDLSIGVSGSYKLNKQTVLKSGVDLVMNTPENSLKLHTSLGVLLQLSKQTAMGYSLETQGEDVLFVTKIKRGHINFEIPLYLSHAMSYKGWLIGAACVLFGSFLTKKIYSVLYKNPKAQLKKEKESEIEEKKFLHRQELLSIIPNAKRMADEEAAKKGLVVIEAFYGKSDIIEKVRRNEENNSEEILDVKYLIQHLVENSKLNLSNTTKSTLPGFYNPCVDASVKPYLYIKYSYGDAIDMVIAKDEDAINIPI